MRTQIELEMRIESKCLGQSFLRYQCIFGTVGASGLLERRHLVYLKCLSLILDSLFAGLSAGTNPKPHGARTCHLTGPTKPWYNWLAHARSFEYIYRYKLLPFGD